MPSSHRGREEPIVQLVSDFGQACISIVDAHEEWNGRGRPPVSCDWFLLQRLSANVDVVREFTLSLARSLRRSDRIESEELADLLAQLLDLGFVTLAIADDMDFLPPMVPIVCAVLEGEGGALFGRIAQASQYASKSARPSQASQYSPSDLLRAAIALKGVVLLFTNTAPLLVSLGMILMGPERDS